MLSTLTQNIRNKCKSLIGRSLILNSFDFGIQIIAMFVVTPSMVRSLGQNLYGQWLILMAIVGYLPILEAGVASAGVKFLASARFHHDSSLFARRLGAIHRWLWRAGWIAGGVLLALAAIALWMDSLESSALPDSSTVFLIFTPPTLLTFWLKERLLVLRAYLRYDLVVITTVLRTLIQTAAVLWVLNHVPTLPWLALAHAGPQAACYIAQHMLASRVLHEHKNFMLPPTLGELSELWAISRHVFASQIAMSLSSRAEPFMVTGFASVQSVPLHGIARRFTGLLADAFQTIFGAVLTTSFSTLAGAGNPSQLHDELGRRCRFVAALAGGGCATLHLIAPPFLAVWLPPAFAASATLLNFVLPGLALRMAAIPTSAFLMASNRHRTLSKLSWILCLVNLTGMALLGCLLGLTGLFAAIGAADVIMFGFILPCCLRPQLPRVARFHAKHTLYPAAVGAMVPTLLSQFIRPLLTPSYTHIFIFTILAAVTVLCTSYLIARNSPKATR